jgi:hypothetical protein
MEVSKGDTKEQVQPQVEEKSECKHAISPEELKQIFMSEVEAETQPAPVESSVCAFNGIEEFAAWYSPLREQFEEHQKPALDSLIKVAGMINQGCGCKRNIRVRQANDYFKIFWENNSATDLPAKVLQVGGFTSISFNVDNHTILIFPTPDKPAE